MAGTTEKATLVAVGAVFLILGLILVLWGSNVMSTVSSCTSSFWCNLGASLEGRNLTGYYQVGLVLEAFGAVLGVFGLVVVTLHNEFADPPEVLY